MIKNKIERLLPTGINDYIRQFYFNFRLLRYYLNDFLEYSNNSFGTSRKSSLENMRGRITLHYHSIEKGMSHEDLRLGFGKLPLKNLLYSLEEYEKKQFPKDDERYMSALKILVAYILLHEKNNYDVSELKKNVIERLKYSGFSFEKIKGFNKPFREYKKSEVQQHSQSSFDKLAMSRVSVRDYSNKPINLDTINDAIQIAITTPSVCNRQPWKVYVINNKNIIDKVLDIQKGLDAKTRSNVKNLLVVTTDIDYYSNDKERNQAYVDGGLFSMSLLYALHYKNLAACSLNGNQSPKELKRIKKIVAIKDSERIIMYMSVGNYKESFQTPVSYKDKLDSVIEYRI